MTKLVSSLFKVTFFTMLSWTMTACFEDNSGSEEGEEIDCSTFAYSETVYVIKPGQPNLVRPLNELRGTFKSSPNGLAINSTTGEIDINASETGLKYKISFTPTGTEQVCDFFVTISGVNYLDGIYILGRNETILSPVYNGVPGLPLPCPDDDGTDDDDDDSCKFDEDDVLKDLGFEISSKGVFDLQKTVENGTFGDTPKNGTILDIELFYRLADLSALASNKIPLRFFYYNKYSDIPKAVLDDIEEKRKLINEVTVPISSNFRLLNTVRPAGKPRPPYVVIVASFE